MLNQILLVLDLVVALMLIGLILIQQGKGADMGASFGGGGSNTVFGSSGSGNFMTKATSILAALFFVINLALGNMSSEVEKEVDEWENLNAPAVSTTPINADVPVASLVPGDASDVPSSSNADDGKNNTAAQQSDDDGQ